MENGVHSSKDDGASAAADWACSSSWAGAWSTNDDWSGELWTPLPPNSSPAGPSAIVQDPQPTGRAKVCMHTLAFPAGGWGILGYIYIYITEGPPGNEFVGNGVRL